MVRAYRRLFEPDSVAVSVSVNTVALVLLRAVGLVRTIILAWLLAAEQFGLFGLSLLVINVLLPFCSAGLHEGVLRYAPLHEGRGTLRPFVARCGVLLAAFSVVSAAVLLLCSDVLEPILFETARAISAAGSDATTVVETTGLLRASLACVVTLAGYQTLIGLLKGLRMFRAGSVAELGTGVLFTVLAVTLPLMGYPTAKALLWSYALSNLVALAVFLPGLVASLPIGADIAAGADLPAEAGVALERAPRGTPPLLRYSLWAAATAVLWHALSYYPMWHLLRVTDQATVGYFHAVRAVTQLVQIVAAMLTAIVAAHAAALWEQQGREHATARLNLFTNGSLLLLFTGGTMLLIARPVVMRLFPATFAAGTAAYNLMLLSFLLVGAVGLLTVRLNLLEKPRLACLAWLGGVAVNVLVAFALLGPVTSGAVSSIPGETIAGADALRSAAWASVAGVAVALSLVTVLLAGVRYGPPASTLLLFVLALSVGVGWGLAVPMWLAALLLGGTTSAFFTSSQRTELRTWVERVRRRRRA